jgi:hypothetical protein
LTVNFLVGDVSAPTLSSLKLLNSGFSIQLDKRDSYLQLSGDRATLHYDQTGLLWLPAQLFTDAPHPLPPEALQSQQDEAALNEVLQASLGCSVHVRNWQKRLSNFSLAKRTWVGIRTISEPHSRLNIYTEAEHLQYGW